MRDTMIQQRMNFNNNKINNMHTVVTRNPVLHYYITCIRKFSNVHHVECWLCSCLFYFLIFLFIKFIFFVVGFTSVKRVRLPYTLSPCTPELSQESYFTFMFC